MSKRIPKEIVPPLSEKVKVLYLKRKEKNHMLRLLRRMVRMNLLSMKNFIFCHEVVRKEKEICASLVLHLRL